MTSVQTKEQLLEQLRHCSEEIGRLGVEYLGLFGSFRRDDAKPSSDVDVLVQFRPGHKSYANLFALKQLLTEQLGRKVEVVTPANLPDAIRAQVLEELEYVEEAVRLPQ